MGTLGRVVHYSVDAILLSTVLAGVRRSSGLSFNTSKIEGAEFRNIMAKYLDIGEWMMDTSIVLLATSRYFERPKKE